MYCVAGRRGMIEGEHMDLKVLQDKIAEFRDARDWHQFHTRRNLAVALSVEAAELLAHYIWTEDENLLDEDEIADIMIYALAFCDVAGIDAEDAILDKLDANEARYPANIARGNHAKYTELQGLSESKGDSKQIEGNPSETD